MQSVIAAATAADFTSPFTVVDGGGDDDDDDDDDVGEERDVVLFTI